MGAETANHWGRQAMLGGLIVLLSFHTAVAQFAGSSYFMDSSSDCHKSGYLLISNDGVVDIHSRKPSGPSSDVQQCILRFRPEDTRHIIDVQFTHFTMSDSGVTLHVDVTGGGTYTLTAGSSKPNALSSKGGMATITLSRLSLDDRDYAFGITIRVYKEDDGQVGVDDSPGPVGLVVGLILGVVAFLVFLAILIVCCYRRKKDQYHARAHERSYKADLAEETMSPSDTYGLDNAAQKGMFTPRRDPEAGDDYENYSPRMERKPLTPPVDEFDYRDRSGSESDSKDRYIVRDYDRSPRKTTNVKYEDENSQNSWQESRRPREYGRNEGNFDQKQTQRPRSPELNSQHANPRFRPEREVAPRTPRMKGDSSETDSVSDASSRERVNRGDVSISQKPQPPEKTPRKPYPLPSASKSPKSTAGQENTPRSTQPQQQDTSRNTQSYLGSSSSSSSETEQTREGKGDAYPEEKAPFTVAEEKPDTRHTLRPDRTNKKKSPEKAKASPESVRTEPVNSSKPPKPAKEKSKPAKTSKSDKKAGSNPKQDASEYEGRFKKADSARKSKSKPQRIGRSRSTGNALDDTESIGRGSVSSAGGYRAVPSVTADDYEDSDAESNYNPLRRTTSKTSLYASRSSLYGRRRRKNSFGESVYSFAYDDPDYFDRGSVKDRSLSRRHRGFKSLGDLEMELREQSTRSTQTLRETASQTRPRKNSVSSTSGRSKSRDRKTSASSTSGRPKRAKSESELRRKAREAEEDREVRPPREKPTPRPKPRPRKSTTTVDEDSSQGGMQPAMPVYAPQGYPGYMVGYPPQMPYIGQPPGVVPYGMVPVLPGAALPNPGAALPGGLAASGPATAPKPSLDKWEMLCRMTDAAKERDDGESVA